MSPSIMFSLTVATCYGCAFHALFGRRLWQWPLFWGVALVGFFLGYVVGIAIGFEALRIGSVPMAAATLGSFVALSLAWYFSVPWSGTMSSQDSTHPNQP